MITFSATQTNTSFGAFLTISVKISMSLSLFSFTSLENVSIVNINNRLSTFLSKFAKTFFTTSLISSLSPLKYEKI